MNRFTFHHGRTGRKQRCGTEWASRQQKIMPLWLLRARFKTIAPKPYDTTEKINELLSKMSAKDWSMRKCMRPLQRNMLKRPGNCLWIQGSGVLRMEEIQNQGQIVFLQNKKEQVSPTSQSPSATCWMDGLSGPYTKHMAKVDHAPSDANQIGSASRSFQESRLQYPIDRCSFGWTPIHASELSMLREKQTRLRGTKNISKTFAIFCIVSSSFKLFCFEKHLKSIVHCNI